jgi:hypothetical protein
MLHCLSLQFNVSASLIFDYSSYEIAPCITRSLQVLAADINVPDPSQLVFVANASAGVNAVMRSIVWKKGLDYQYIFEDDITFA